MSIIDKAKDLLNKSKEVVKETIEDVPDIIENLVEDVIETKKVVEKRYDKWKAKYNIEDEPPRLMGSYHAKRWYKQEAQKQANK